MGQDPKPKAPKKTGNSWGSSWNGYFINVELTESDKKAVKEFEFDEVRVLEWLGTRCSEGFKFSLSLQEDGSSYLASLTDRREKAASFQGTLTGRGKTTELAITSLFYKDVVLLEGVWPARNKPSDEVG